MKIEYKNLKKKSIYTTKISSINTFSSKKNTRKRDKN